MSILTVTFAQPAPVKAVEVETDNWTLTGVNAAILGLSGRHCRMGRGGTCVEYRDGAHYKAIKADVVATSMDVPQ